MKVRIILFLEMDNTLLIIGLGWVGREWVKLIKWKYDFSSVAVSESILKQKVWTFVFVPHALQLGLFIDDWGRYCLEEIFVPLSFFIEVIIGEVSKKIIL